jgi:hypothetical protein
VVAMNARMDFFMVIVSLVGVEMGAIAQRG